MSAPEVLERKVRLDGTTDDFMCERLLLEPGRRAVLRYQLDRDWPIADVLLVPKGSFTIGHYWVDRPYNVYHWVRPETLRAQGPLRQGPRRTIAYYCNVVSSTTIAEDLVSYDDLVVDVLIDTAGSATVLDEDDLPSDLPSPKRAVINRALEELTGNSRRIAAEIERASEAFLRF